MYFHRIPIAELDKWLHGSKPGDRLVYAEGRNTFYKTQWYGPCAGYWLFKRAKYFSDTGPFALFQKRDGDFTTYYIQRLSERSAKFLKGIANG